MVPVLVNNAACCFSTVLSFPLPRFAKCFAYFFMARMEHLPIERLDQDPEFGMAALNASLEEHWRASEYCQDRLPFYRAVGGVCDSPIQCGSTRRGTRS